MKVYKKLLVLFLFGLFSLNVSARNPEIVRAIEDGDLDRVEQLVEEGADLDVLIRRRYKDYTETLLHRAVYQNQPKILQLLINAFKEKGISIDKMGTCYGSALMYACCLSMPECVEILIKNDAGVNFNNGGGETPFMCAVDPCGRIENCLECCYLLKKAGARLSMSCNDLDDAKEYNKIWPFIKKNITFSCKLKYLLWRVLSYVSDLSDDSSTD